MITSSSSKTNTYQTSIDGIIEVSNEATYNKMNDAMVNFRMSIFKNEQKSYYSTHDVNILDEFRTVANVGWMEPVKSKSTLLEIDISKAYTAAIAKIKSVPVFNEFDRFKPYEGEELSIYSLYI